MITKKYKSVTEETFNLFNHIRNPIVVRKFLCSNLKIYQVSTEYSTKNALY
jgi:hypothetical protein